MELFIGGRAQGKLELVLRDTHTVRCEKERFDLWISIAREAIERNWQD